MYSLRRCIPKYSNLRYFSTSNTPSEAITKPQQKQKRMACAFDIDGVLLRSGVPIGGSEEVMSRISSLKYNGSKDTFVPYVVLTNGSGMTEEQKSDQLESRLGFSLDPTQVILAHSPLHRYNLSAKHNKVLIVGMNKLHDVASSFGLQREQFYTPSEFLAYIRSLSSEKERFAASSSIDAIIVITDSSNWETDIGACAHIIRAHYQNSINQNMPISLPEFYSCNYDWVFSADYNVPRMAGGSFTSTIFDVSQKYVPEINLLRTMPIHYLGKPFPETYRYAESLLANQIPDELILEDIEYKEHDTLIHRDITLHDKINYLKDNYDIYAFGDNPLADLLGANDAGDPWISVAVQTGTISLTPEKMPKRLKPAYCFDTVCDGVNYFLEQHNLMKFSKYSKNTSEEAKKQQIYIKQ